MASHALIGSDLKNLQCIPFVIMKGFIEGIIDADAKRALSSPEEPDLFAT